MNIPNFKYKTDNFAIAGVTRILYNVWLEPICTDHSLYDYETENIVEIGFQYKIHGNLLWITVPIVEKTGEEDEPYFTSYNEIHSIVLTKSDPADENYYFETCSYHAYEILLALYTEKLDPMIFPINVIIKNVSPDTSYDLRTYVKYNIGDEENNWLIYGTQTVKTRKRVSGAEATFDVYFTQALIDDFNDRGNLNLTLDNYKLSEEYHYYNDDIQFFCTNVINSMINFHRLSRGYYEPKVELRPINGASNTGGGGAGHTTYLYANLPLYNHLLDEGSVMVHETAHMVFICDELEVYKNLGMEYYDDIVRIMEFASHVPYAIWKWKGKSHNYPFHNIRGLSYFEDHIAVHAWAVIDRDYTDEEVIDD